MNWDKSGGLSWRIGYIEGSWSDNKRYDLSIKVQVAVQLVWRLLWSFNLLPSTRIHIAHNNTRCNVDKGGQFGFWLLIYVFHFVERPLPLQIHLMTPKESQGPHLISNSFGHGHAPHMLFLRHLSFLFSVARIRIAFTGILQQIIGNYSVRKDQGSSSRLRPFCLRGVGAILPSRRRIISMPLQNPDFCQTFMEGYALDIHNHNSTRRSGLTWTVRGPSRGLKMKFREFVFSDGPVVALRREEKRRKSKGNKPGYGSHLSIA